MRIYSEPEQGTTVKVYLPRYIDTGKGASAPAVADDRENGAIARGSEGILVVEDNAEVRAYAREALTDRVTPLSRRPVLRRNISVLQKKVGINSPEKKFRFFLKQIAFDGHIPDYDISIDGPKTIFTRRPNAPTRRLPSKREQGDLFDVGLRVSPDAFDKARRLAPVYDVHALYHEWLAFAEKQDDRPRNATAAFLGFCKRRHSSAPLG